MKDKRKIHKKRTLQKLPKLKIVLPIAGIIAGIMIIMVPVILNMINKGKDSEIISTMTARYDNYQENRKEIERQLLQADLYNKTLAGISKVEILGVEMLGEEISDEDMLETATSEIVPYDEQLSFDGNGIMSWIEIPKAGIKMLIYHGTSDETLAIGAGHLQGTSLPVGGESTHSVITAHSGMKNMKAFDNLRKLEAGDIFTITTLGIALKYKVESTEVVLPYETESLGIVAGKDLVTLVTCTPYGINDHRLLVHAVRVA